MYGREPAGHSSTSATHHPDEITRVTAAASSCTIRRPSLGRPKKRYTAVTTGTMRKAWSIFARKPVPMRKAASTSQRVRPLSTARSVP